MLWKVLHLYWANVILAACFTLRGHDTHIDLLWLLFLVGRICPLILAHFLWPLLKRKAFLLRLNKGSNFLQSAFWIWISKWFSLVRECKIIRMKCSFNWSYINLLWRIELWLSKLPLIVFLKIVWVFWMERVVPPLVIALNKVNSL